MTALILISAPVLATDSLDNSAALQSILEEMTVVENSFISLIGWQSQGHVPMTF
jgi:hypothetical protein